MTRAAKKPAAKSRSGTSRSAMARAASGRPSRMFAIRSEIDALCTALATTLELSRSQVVAAALLTLFQWTANADAERRAELAERARR